MTHEDEPMPFPDVTADEVADVAYVLTLFLCVALLFAGGAVYLVYRFIRWALA